MNRASLLAGMIGGFCLAAPMAHAQQRPGADQPDVKVIELLPMGNKPIEFSRTTGVAYPELFEYRIVWSWIWHAYHWPPEYLDLIAVVENSASAPVGPVELDLYRDLEIGDSLDGYCDATPVSGRLLHPEDAAVWQGPILWDTKTIGMLEGKTAVGVNFDPISMAGLRDEYWPQDEWPWTLRFEVAVRCERCSSETMSVEIDFSTGC